MSSEALAPQPAPIAPRRPRAPGPAPNGAGSLARMLEVLDLFTAETPLLRVDDLQARLGYTKSTAYRYVKTLCDAGLLAQPAQGCYALGPRIVELERLMRIADPLLQAGEAVLPSLAAEVPNSMVLLCSLYRDKVLCVHREGPEAIQAGGRSITILRARGLPLPLFQGAASLAILAWLPPHRIRALFLLRQAAMAAAGLGADWAAVRQRLAGIRREGFVATAGRFNRHLAAVSVPVLSRDGSQVAGSLTRIMALSDYAGQEPALLARALQGGAGQVSARLA
ncbi:IclR family transcriptional regulator [Falsiroseomonas selenitidurans]|uniref:Helix-turn-helix domain-containing protein n=1 Tax=Falsiroseomonas selenitidurans TaxID=2716335 RepID=A0ABX1E0S7_9PROT|nr:helix-turn-helix domain-containing protein [Falsiroseomonas selenitidurans]NKC30759.1 helix-turn-helix domain-containing protein [Falsiroseomonas selenitidurans]